MVAKTDRPVFAFDEGGASLRPGNQGTDGTQYITLTLWNGNSTTIGIPNPVGHIMKRNNQDIGCGSFGGFPHLTAYPLNKMPGR